jgi:hypothetical protein
VSTIPTIPSGAQADSGANYRTVLPRATEVSSLVRAVSDFQSMSNFSQLFGITGLQYAQVLAAFVIAAQWTAMRGATETWGGYCLSEEGKAWTTVRAFMQLLKPLFDAAAKGDPNLASVYPGIAALFGAQKVIAQKGATTRKNNKTAEAKGELADHGTVGKRRTRVAAKAALEAQQTASQSTAPAASTTTAPATTPATHT